MAPTVLSSPPPQGHTIKDSNHYNVNLLTTMGRFKARAHLIANYFTDLVPFLFFRNPEKQASQKLSKSRNLF